MKELSLLHELLRDDRLSCVDVGAAGGIAEEWRDYASLLSVDAFDPNADAHRSDPRDGQATRWYPIALGRATEKRKFYVLNRPTGSSFYPPNEELMREHAEESYFKLQKVIELDTLSFSDFLRQYARPKPNLIKLDTQGSELEILRSLAPDDWSEVALIVSEVEFEELYKGQPLFHEVDAFIQAQGFRLFDLRTARSYRSGQQYMSQHFNLGVGRSDFSAKLYAGDALYVRDWRKYDMTPNNRWLKLILSLLMHRYYDLAIHLSELALAQGVLAQAQQHQLRAEIVELAPRPHLHERADVIGKALRMALSAVGYDGCRQTFWMRRSYPDQ